METALAAGASINAVDEKGLSPLGLGGLTPLGLAAAFGHRNVAEFLLEHGANVDAVSADGLEQTPLNEAAKFDSADVAALLLDHGADVNARDIAGATPLGWAGLRGYKNVAALLIARGALVNAQAYSGKTPLHLAATAGKKELVVLLLSHGADPKIKNSDGQTPFQEMEASDLDPASKTSVAAVLRAPARKSNPPRPVASVPAPATTVPPPANTQAPNGLPACTDVGAIVRWLMQANPDWSVGRFAGALVYAVMNYQVLMGCR